MYWRLPYSCVPYCSAFAAHTNPGALLLTQAPAFPMACLGLAKQHAVWTQMMCPIWQAQPRLTPTNPLVDFGNLLFSVGKAKSKSKSW